ncbi:class II D-tagatose-bisphosphate aldolase, non-catalytic subunit [Salmonella enterica]
MFSLEKLVQCHRAGEQIRIYSVCSAPPLVIGATLEQVLDNGYKNIN